MAGRNLLPEDKKPRLIAIRKRLKEISADALLITGTTHLRYLSGFTGSEGIALITKTGRHLLVDSRYTTQAGRQAPGYRVMEITRRPREVGDFLKKQKVKVLAFEPDTVSHARYLELKKAFKGVRLVDFGDAVKKLRSRKNSGEVRLIKKAADIAYQAFEKSLPKIKPGIRERELALIIETKMRELGSEGAPFPTIVASGPRGALPHGIASDKKIRKGELVTVDFGAMYKGYQSDQTITFCMGRPTKKQALIYATVRDAHDLAIKAIRPGATCREVDGIARDHIQEKGYGKYFGHGLGHGVGLETHEGPVLGPRNQEALLEGAVVTVEPGIYIPGWGGVRIEDMVIVTARGCRLLTRSGGELRRV